MVYRGTDASQNMPVVGVVTRAWRRMGGTDLSGRAVLPYWFLGSRIFTKNANPFSALSSVFLVGSTLGGFHHHTCLRGPVLNSGLACGLSSPIDGAQTGGFTEATLSFADRNYPELKSYIYIYCHIIVNQTKLNIK